jgi:hypothetical protein
MNGVEGRPTRPHAAFLDRLGDAEDQSLTSTLDSKLSQGSIRFTFPPLHGECLVLIDPLLRRARLQ